MIAATDYTSKSAATRGQIRQWNYLENPSQTHVSETFRISGAVLIVEGGWGVYLEAFAGDAWCVERRDKMIRSRQIARVAFLTSYHNKQQGVFQVAKSDTTSNISVSFPPHHIEQERCVNSCLSCFKHWMVAKFIHDWPLLKHSYILSTKLSINT